MFEWDDWVDTGGVGSSVLSSVSDGEVPVVAKPYLLGYLVCKRCFIVSGLTHWLHWYVKPVLLSPLVKALMAVSANLKIDSNTSLSKALFGLKWLKTNYRKRV